SIGRCDTQWCGPPQRRCPPIAIRPRSRCRTRVGTPPSKPTRPSSECGSETPVAGCGSKRGPQFRRQMEAFRQIANGEAVAGELAILDHVGVMVKMAAWLPREDHKGARADVLTVRTGKDCLLIAVKAKDEALWRYNGDHLRRWAGEHRTQLQRWSEDQKDEQTAGTGIRSSARDSGTEVPRRMNSTTHEIAAQLTGYASRRHFAQVRYDDSEHSYIGPWYRLRSFIAGKLDA